MAAWLPLMREAFSPPDAAVWFGRFTAALSLGAACGGIFLGWLGDRIGRARAMAVSILCYTGFAGAAGCAQSQEQLLVLRFLAGMGIGGMWPNGVSLVAEIWPDVSRPVLAGELPSVAIHSRPWGSTAQLSGIPNQPWLEVLALKVEIGRAHV